MSLHTVTANELAIKALRCPQDRARVVHHVEGHGNGAHARAHELERYRQRVALHRLLTWVQVACNCVFRPERAPS
jgi:hypothetical protein